MMIPFHEQMLLSCFISYQAEVTTRLPEMCCHFDFFVYLLKKDSLNNIYEVMPYTKTTRIRSVNLVPVSALPLLDK
jgi:hypothetical protein